MKYSKAKYKNRLVDSQIAKYLKIFPAISIEGPKWCGKTWTANNMAKVQYIHCADKCIKNIERKM